MIPDDAPRIGDSSLSDTEHKQRRELYIDGARWTVRLWASAYDRRSRPDLIFESDDAFRRVREYPDNWPALPDAELFALSQRR